MANPWEDYATPTAPAAPATVDVPEEPGMEPEVGELPAAPAAPAAPVAPGANPADEFTLGEDAALTTTVTDEGPYQPEPPRELTSNGEAMWRGLQSGALMGWDDELQAAAGAGGNALGSLFGLNNSTASIGEIYDRIVAERRASKDQALADNPWAYGVGFTPGMLMSAFATRGRGAPEGATVWQRLGAAAREGATQGAISGAGNAGSGIEETAAGAGIGGAMGAPLGALSVPIGDAIANVGGRAYRAFRPAPGADSGLDVLAAQAPQDVGAMRAEVQRFQQAGVSPRLLDVVDESGRGVVRAAAGAKTPAREAAARHADDVYTSMQDRVAGQARANISDAPQTARQMERQIRGDRNLGGDNEAGVLMGQAMEPLRSMPIQIDDTIKSVLSTREGQAALRGAEGLMTDPAERAMVRKVLSAARQHSKGPVDVEDAFRAEVKGWDDLPDVIKDAYRAQRPDLMEAGDAFAGTELTLDMADKFARAMKGRAAKTPGLERVANDFANAVRGAARGQSKEYDDALSAYAARQGVADAAAGTGKFEESAFLRTPTDTYRATVNAASPTPAAVEGAAGPLPEFVDYPNAAKWLDTPEMRSVDRAQITRSQRDVDPDGVARYRAGTGQMQGEPIEAVFDPASGRYIITDGHHRLAALDGDGPVDLNVTGINPNARSPFPRAEPTVSERDALRARARDEVVDRATSGSGSGAPGVARQLARGSGQRERSAALVGDEAAGRLQRGMEAEVNRLDNTRYIDERVGSKTAGVARDAIVDGFADAIPNVVTGGRWAVAREVARWLKKGGIRNVDAERLTRDAISDDPARLEQAISYLEQKGMKRARAERFLNTIGGAMAGRIAGATIDDGQ